MDFDTDNMRYRAVTHIHWGMTNPAALWASHVVEDTRLPLIQYIAKRMALVATPYWPCTDLKQPEDSDGT